MANYTKSTNFTAKDALTTGDPNKLVKGSEHDAEYDAIETSSATKANKIVSGVTNNVIKQSASGDLTDAGYSFSGLVGDTAVTKAEVDILDGATVTTAELNLLDGVTALASTDDVIDNFPSGTLMLFQQTAAPTGWTKQTTHNDKTLRVVSGSVVNGGTVAFTTTFGASIATDNYTLLEADVPAHSHGSAGAHTHNHYQGTGSGVLGGSSTTDNTYGGQTAISGAESSAGTHTHTSFGGGGAHAHDISNMDLAYVDIIIASKD